MGPIALWQTAIITKDDLVLIVFSRNGTNWTIMRGGGHYSVSRMFLREKLVSVKFMVIVTDPRNESTHEIFKVYGDITETTPLTYLARALLELVPRPGWSQHFASRPIKPPELPTPQREKKPLIAETIECEKDEVVGNTHDDRIPMTIEPRSMRSTRIKATRLPVPRSMRPTRTKSDEASSAKVDKNERDEASVATIDVSL